MGELVASFLGIIESRCFLFEKLGDDSTFSDRIREHIDFLCI